MCSEHRSQLERSLGARHVELDVTLGITENHNERIVRMLNRVDVMHCPCARIVFPEEATWCVYSQTGRGLYATPKFVQLSLSDSNGTEPEPSLLRGVSRLDQRYLREEVNVLVWIQLTA